MSVVVSYSELIGHRAVFAFLVRPGGVVVDRIVRVPAALTAL